MKEIKIGEKFTITLEAVESDNCKDCFFYGLACPCMLCSGSERSDGKFVIFKEVKE